MKRHRLIILYILTIVVIGGCGKGKSKDDPSPGGTSGGTPVTPSTDPAKALLSFPAQNSACTTGTVVSQTQSTITFTWNSATNADNYDITVKNLLSGISVTQSVNTNQYTATLERNTPYAWYILSKSTKNVKTAQSDTWKFYNSGPGIVSHPPFPADAVSPLAGAQVTAGKVDLKWAATDADNDITTYDLYFGTATNPVILASGLSTPGYTGLNIQTGNVYCWKIITKDGQGNTSESGTFYFTAK